VTLPNFVPIRRAWHI